MLTLYTFTSVHHMMRAEKLLKELSIASDVLPTPRAISTSCGLCIVVPAADAPRAEAVFLEREIVAEGRYEDAAGQGLYKGRLNSGRV